MTVMKQARVRCFHVVQLADVGRSARRVQAIDVQFLLLYQYQDTAEFFVRRAG
jgi:hypothetical protein